MRNAFLALFYAILALIAIPFVLLCFLTGMRRAIIGFGKWAMRVGRWALGLRIEVAGLDRIDPKTAYIFMPNHVSFLDGPLMVMVIPRQVRVILKKSVFKIPIVGQAMFFVGFVSVDRKGVRGGRRSIDRAAKLMRERGYSFLIFPEGTRSRDGNMQELRRGGFFLALESGAPIVPVTIQGTFELMPKGQWYARKGIVKVVFHEPVSVQSYRKETIGGLMEKVRERIALGITQSNSSRETGQTMRSAAR